MERVVIYSRVSTDIQNTERQELNLIDYCKRNDLEVVKLYSEKISGIKKSDDRPELKSLLMFVTDKTNRIDGVVVTEISRLGRRLSSVLDTK